MTARAELVIDVAAIRHNVRLLKELTGTQLMTVVKADGYGHGLAETARAAREGGADWLGVATIDEALALREAVTPDACCAGSPSPATTGRPRSSRTST